MRYPRVETPHFGENDGAKIISGLSTMYFNFVLKIVNLKYLNNLLGTMFKIHTLPIFALRPMYLAIRKFRKSLSDIVLSRRAIAQLEVYPNATEAELANDNVCIICREEMVPGSR